MTYPEIDPSEAWAPIPRHPDYEVSTLGRVRSWKTYGPVKPRILVTHMEGGYVRATLSRAQRRVHQLVLEAFVGPRPEGLLTRHLDGDPTNNRLDNLAYGTPSENMRDRRDHGTDANVNKTKCANGHELTSENTLIRKRPSSSSGGPTYRACRICRNKVKRENYHRSKGRLLAAMEATK